MHERNPSGQLVELVQLVQLVHLVEHIQEGSSRRPATVGWEACLRLLRDIRRRMSAAGISSALSADRAALAGKQAEQKWVSLG